MQNLNNLPSRIPRIFAFRDQNLDIRFLFPDGYDVSGITAKAFYKDKYHNGLISITTSGQLVTATITKEDFLTVGLPVFDIYIYRNSTALLGASIQIENKSGTPNTQTFNVTIVDGFVVNVDVTDANAVIDAAERAETAADLASELAIQVSEDKQSVSSDKADVMEAKATVEAIANADVTVETYVDAVSYFTGSIKRDIFINQASQYNDAGEFFTWYPTVQKAAHLGLDFDYLTNV